MVLVFTIAFVTFLFMGSDANLLKILDWPLHLTPPFLNNWMLNRHPSSKRITLHNWGNNFHFSTQNIQYPSTVEEVQEIVKDARKVRVVGTRHSFSTIADSPDTLVSTLALKNIIGFDPTVPSITVQAGITYTDLNPYIQYLGYALPNQASLSEISVGGAAQTGAHGSGLNHKCLASQIRSLQIVLANGTLATIGPNDPQLKAIALGLGAFGVITQVELVVEPTYNLTNYVFVNMTDEQLYDNFDEIENMGYSVQLFRDFSVPGKWNQVWIFERSDSNGNVGTLESLHGAPRSHTQITAIQALPPTYIMTEGKEQPWYFGLVDYHLGLSGFDGNEIQSEYFMPYKNAVPALKAKNNMTAIMEVLPQIEKAILPFGARPHWGKVYVSGPETYLKYYPKLNDWKKLTEKFDPTHKFRNEFLEKNVYVNSGGIHLPW